MGMCGGVAARAGEGADVFRGGRSEKFGFPVAPRGENGRVTGPWSSCHDSGSVCIEIGGRVEGESESSAMTGKRIKVGVIVHACTRREKGKHYESVV